MGLSHYHLSALGVAECDDCVNQWPCHLAAWGNPARVSRCNACGGDVSWSPVEVDEAA